MKTAVHARELGSLSAYARVSADRGASLPVRIVPAVHSNCSAPYATVVRRARALKSRAVSRNTSVRAVAELPKPWKTKDARIVLEDGSVWPGVAFGAKGTKIGEVVFNTSLTGYQEIMTDPSYKEQFVCFTLPHIGNVGINLGTSAHEWRVRFKGWGAPVYWPNRKLCLEAVILLEVCCLSSRQYLPFINWFCKEFQLVLGPLHPCVHSMRLSMQRHGSFCDRVMLLLLRF